LDQPQQQEQLTEERHGGPQMILAISIHGVFLIQIKGSSVDMQSDACTDPEYRRQANGKVQAPACTKQGSAALHHPRKRFDASFEIASSPTSIPASLFSTYHPFNSWLALSIILALLPIGMLPYGVSTHTLGRFHLSLNTTARMIFCVGSRKYLEWHRH
jgi:hypothetical protein